MSTTDKIRWSEIEDVGLYTVSMAARLLGESAIRVRSWIDGYPNSDATPIICRQLPAIDGRTVLGFLDLIEARFVKHFADLGLSPQSIRKVAEKLRRRTNTDHPFATNKRFMTDGRAILMETVETEEEKRVLNLMNDNFEMAPVVEPSLFASILYADDLAYRWRPIGALPHVVLDPQYVFGRPAIEGCWIPTETLFTAFCADKDVDLVAEDFEIDTKLVEQAIAFEQRLSTRAGIEDPVR